jgi:hypothetical protein
MKSNNSFYITANNGSIYKNNKSNVFIIYYRNRTRGTAEGKRFLRLKKYTRWRLCLVATWWWIMAPQTQVIVLYWSQYNNHPIVMIRCNKEQCIYRRQWLCLVYSWMLITELHFKNVPLVKSYRRGLNHARTGHAGFSVWCIKHLNVPDFCRYSTSHTTQEQWTLVQLKYLQKAIMVLVLSTHHLHVLFDCSISNK